MYQVVTKEGYWLVFKDSIAVFETEASAKNWLSEWLSERCENSEYTVIDPKTGVHYPVSHVPDSDFEVLGLDSAYAFDSDD